VVPPKWDAQQQSVRFRLPLYSHAKKKACCKQKSTQKKAGKILSFNRSVVDQSVDPPVKDSSLLTFNIPVIGLPSGSQHFSTAKEAKINFQNPPKVKQMIQDGNSTSKQR